MQKISRPGFVATRRQAIKSIVGGAAAVLAAPYVHRAYAADDTIRIGYIDQFTGARANFAERAPWVIDQIKAHTKDGLVIGGKTYAVEILSRDSQSDPNRMGSLGNELVLREDVDLLLLPTVPVEPFAADREAPESFVSPSQVLAWTGWTPFTYPFNLSGNPAASLPCGLTANGLPVGLQVVGRRHADALVMAFCQQAENHIFNNKIPPLAVAGGKAGWGTPSNPTAEITSWNSTGEHS